MKKFMNKCKATSVATTSKHFHYENRRAGIVRSIRILFVRFRLVVDQASVRNRDQSVGKMMRCTRDTRRDREHDSSIDRSIRRDLRDESVDKRIALGGGCFPADYWRAIRGRCVAHSIGILSILADKFPVCATQSLGNLFEIQ